MGVRTALPARTGGGARLAALVRIPRARLIAGLLPGLRSVSAVAAAYLFGSALDAMRPDSDIDLALVGRPGADSFALAGEVEAACRSVAGHPVHATVLDDAGTIFAFRVLSAGVLIHCADAEALTDLIERVARRYEEVGAAHRRALAEVYG